MLDKIKNSVLAELDNSISDAVGRGMQGLGNMIGDAAGAVKDFAVDAWNTAADFAERTVNMVAHGEFINNDEYNFLYGSNVNEFYNSDIGKEMLANGELRGPITDDEIIQTAFAKEKEIKSSYYAVVNGKEISPCCGKHFSPGHGK